MVKDEHLSKLADIRNQFPLLQRSVNGKQLCYLDNAATSQKPSVVIERMARFYRSENANIHRGVHVLSQEATEAYESARRQVAEFLGAQSSKEIVFTRGATESINLVAAGLVQTFSKRGGTVLLTGMEHHANIVPWQLLRERHGLQIAVAGIDAEGCLDREDFSAKLHRLRPDLVSLTHVCNATGVINPIDELIAEAHSLGIPVLVDACQSVPHFPINVRELDCDWLVFSGHKVFGPTGIGVLFGKESRLEALPPYQGGGDMIESVSFEKTVFKGPPEKFEAGTPNIAGALGLGAALAYLSELDREQLMRHEASLLALATDKLECIPGLRIIGNTGPKASVVSFVMEAAHSHDIASFLDAEGIAIRSGHHCTQPLMATLGLTGTARASFSFYNTEEEVLRLVEGLHRIQRFFA